jgi:oligopeptide/dipeptide ABC transporter ATP-binding protein
VLDWAFLIPLKNEHEGKESGAFEIADKNELYNNPHHPNTKVLLSAISFPKSNVKLERVILAGGVPSSIELLSGYNFNTRCPLTEDLCKIEESALPDIACEHHCACHLVKAQDSRKTG